MLLKHAEIVEINIPSSVFIIQHNHLRNTTVWQYYRQDERNHSLMSQLQTQRHVNQPVISITMNTTIYISQYLNWLQQQNKIIIFKCDWFSKFQLYNRYNNCVYYKMIGDPMVLWWPNVIINRFLRIT